MQWKLGWFANPVFNGGDYPQMMKEKIYENSMAAGLTQSRLPSFTEAEKAMLNGKYNS